MAGAEGRCPIDAPRHALRSPAGTSSPADKAAPSPGFKNTLTLSELVQLLVRRDTDAKERAHAALALQYLSLNADKAMAIVHMPEAIAGLVAMMVEGPDEAQQHAAGALGHLAVNEDAESIIVHSGGVLDALASVLAAGREGSKEEAAAALESLSYSAESAMLVARTEGVIPSLVELLHTSKGKAIENAIGALQNMAVIAECRLEIAATPRALVSIANVLWSGSPKAQEGAASIVGNLAVHSEIRKMVGHTDGVVDGLVALLLDGTEKAKSDAAAALGNLAVNTELRAAILEVPRALYGLRCMLMEGSERHAGEAACCLQNLAVTTIEHKLRIAATEDLLLGLVNLMLRCQPASQFQEDACSALLNLVVGCSENKKAVVSVSGVMQALQRCLQTGSDRTQEHGAALVQNLIFNSHTNRMAVLWVPELVAAISSMVADVSLGSKKAREYATACLASLARIREGALAVVQSQETVEGLIVMSSAARDSAMGCRKASISVLQTVAQTPEAAALLLHSHVADRCFLPVLSDQHALENDENGRRIVVQACIGTAYLSRLDTRLLDRIPQAAIDALVSTLTATVRNDCDNSLKYKAIDLLVPLNVLASKDEVKARLHTTGVVQLMAEILKGKDTDRGGRDSLTDMEAIKLCWHLSFLPASKREMLDANLSDVLAGCTHVNGSYESWVSGLRWQLDMYVVDIEAPTQASLDLKLPANGHVMIIADVSEGEVREVVATNLAEGGHNTWPRTDTTVWPVRMSEFVSAANAAKLALIIMSPSCEVSPCCRSQAAHMKGKKIPILCLNIGSAHGGTYVQHGYLDTEMGACIKCTPSMFEGEANSAFNGILDDFIASGAKSWTADMWLHREPEPGDEIAHGKSSAWTALNQVHSFDGRDEDGLEDGPLTNQASMSAKGAGRSRCWDKAEARGGGSAIASHALKQNEYVSSGHRGQGKGNEQLYAIINHQEQLIHKQQNEIEMLKLQLDLLQDLRHQGTRFREGLSELGEDAHTSPQSVADTSRLQQDKTEAMLQTMTQTVARSMGSMLLRFEDRVEEKLRQEIRASLRSGHEGCEVGGGGGLRGGRRGPGGGGKLIGSPIQGQGVDGGGLRPQGT